jgi:uncharacterized protein (TIGR02001 family)
MKTLHKKALSAAAVALITGLACSSAFAEEAAAEAPEASPVTANVSVVSDYRYRGVSQSNLKPAIQGGFDYAHESGFYIGNWNSSISWNGDQNPGVTSPIEMDFYGGFKKEFIGEGFASDFGVLQYAYPSRGAYSYQTTAGTQVNPNTTELYAAQNFTYGGLTGFVKFSYAVSTLFGNPKSAGSYYPDLTVNYDTGVWGLAVNAHVGYQYVAGQQVVAGTPTLNYTDWKLGLTKDFGGGLSLSAAYIGTDAAKSGSNYAYMGPANQGSKNLAGSTGVVSLTKTF